MNSDTTVRARQSAFVRQAASDPSWHLHFLDVTQGQAGFLRVGRDEIRRSAFLDDRIQLTHPSSAERVLLPLQSLLEDWPDDVGPLAPHFIFHPGHCGSTLVSRLLDQLPGVLGLREPLPLRVLAAQRREQGTNLAQLSPDQLDQLRQRLLSLLGRTFEPDEKVAVKATSECCNLIPDVLRDGGGRVLFVYLDLARFMAVMLRNRVRREESLGYAQSRLADLNNLLGEQSVRLYELDLAEKISLNWVSSMAHATANLDNDRLMTLHFEAFLHEPRRQLASVGKHFGVAVDDQGLDEALASGVLGSYSKDPASAYDPGRRSGDLERSRQENAAAIHRGISFAEKLIRRTPALGPLGAYLRRDPQAT